MDSEASGDRTKDEAILVYEAAAQLLFRYKKQVFWNKEQREFSKENTSLRSVKTASMQVAQLLRRISPKPRCLDIFQAIDFVGTISGFLWISISLGRRISMDFGTIGTALKNIEDVREMSVQYVSVRESEALIFPDLGLLKTASQMKNGRGFVVICGIVSHKVRCCSCCGTKSD